MPRELAVKLKVLPPNSPEAKRRDELLAIMRDPTKSDTERDAAAIAALPLWRELPQAGAMESSDKTVS
jgi:hypothetical protein